MLETQRNRYQFVSFASHLPSLYLRHVAGLEDNKRPLWHGVIYYDTYTIYSYKTHIILGTVGLVSCIAHATSLTIPCLHAFWTPRISYIYLQLFLKPKIESTITQMLTNIILAHAEH